MKKREKMFFVTLIILSVALISQSIYKILNKDDHSKAISDHSINTTFHVQKALVDIGKVKLHSLSEVTFLIRNTGNANLKIFHVVPDCQCTVTNYDKMPIPPNGTAIIKAEYRPNSTGFFQKNIRVELNSDKSPIILTFRGKVMS